MLKENFIISVKVYLQGETDAAIKHEYVNGHLFAMAGASRKHNLIAGNTYAALHTHLRASDCQVFISDMKVHVKTPNDECFYYPDVMVTCQPGVEAQYEDKPVLIVEILSESTERFDREEKFLRYASIPSMREYLLVQQKQQMVEMYRRRAHWKPEYYTIDDTLILESLGLSIAVSEFYSGLNK